MNTAIEIPIPDHVRSKVQVLLPGIKHSKRKGMICPAGSLAGALLKDLLEPGVEITALLDNNEAKRGSTVSGLPVLPISDIENNSPDFVMVASMSFRDEILAQLRPLAHRFGFQLLDLCETQPAPE